MGRSETTYFAYGSNMSSRRLLERVPDAEVRGAARLEAFRLGFDKPSRDGSAKANLIPAPGAHVWGVLWALPAEAWPVLDGFEPGYARVGCEAVTADGRIVSGQTYRYVGPPCDRPPLDGYVDHLIVGADEHALPDDYRRALRAIRDGLGGEGGDGPSR